MNYQSSTQTPDCQRPADDAQHRGEVYLIGAGPGDIELLTLKAVRLLRQADVALIDCLVNRDVLSFTRPGIEVIEVGKRAGQHLREQSWINAEMIRLARLGLRVARIKGGDPLMFGRSGEELEALLGAGIPVQIASGVTAGIAVAAELGIPLTHRDHAHQVTFLTAHMQAHIKDQGPLPHGTLVFYMALKNAGRIRERLIAGGISEDTPVAIVDSGTLPQQQLIFSNVRDYVDELNRHALPGPTLIVVGDVVRLAQRRVNKQEVLA